MTERAAATREIAAALERIRRIDPLVNAVACIDSLLEAGDLPHAATGRLAGMPLLVKDNIEVAGAMPTTAGSLALRHNAADRDAPVVQRLKAAGAVILGKAAMAEWSNFRADHSVPGWSATGGLTRNPHVLDRLAGSSSSGSAVAVATGMVPATIGTETNGSVTSPASINGVVGMKPSVGLVSRQGIVPISYSQGTPGPLAKSVALAADVLAAMAEATPRQAQPSARAECLAALSAPLAPHRIAGMRIGVMRFAIPDNTLASFEDALAVFESLGATLVDIPAFHGREEMLALDRTVMLCEFRACLDEYLASTDPAAVPSRSLADIVAFNERHADRELALFGQDILLDALAAPGMGSAAYRSARDRACDLAADHGIDRMLADHGADVLIGPTQGPAIKLDLVNRCPQTIDGACLLAAVSGYPHLSVPMRPVDDLPVGLSIVGPKWSDALLLSVGMAYERAADLTVEPGYIPSKEDNPAMRAALQRQSLP